MARGEEIDSASAAPAAGQPLLRASHVPPSPLPGEVRPDGPYRTAAYLEAASYLEGADENDCHPALYARRSHVAAKLRDAAQSPSAATSETLLNGVRFLCYRLRATTS